MSQEQERLVREALDLVNAGDVEGIAAITPPGAGCSCCPAWR